MLSVPDSARLRFALLSDQDAQLLFDVDQDSEVMRYINGGTCTSMQTIINIMLPRMALYRDPLSGFGIWQVRRLSDEAYLGWVLIRPMDFTSATPSRTDVEIGWRFKRDYWGQGYASEAAQAIATAVLAQHAAVQYLSAIALPDNTGSIGVMRKLGMQFIKRYLHRDALGEHDAVLYRKKLMGAADENKPKT
ncbi:MAG: GNAT family N-acetyltransferase [Rheinheimera sp.]|nr:GNAT family N-acetyltransferase [Rheinheimera sp.]